MEGPTARLQALAETLGAQLQEPLALWGQAATQSAWSPLASVNPLPKAQTKPAPTPLFADPPIPVTTPPTSPSKGLAHSWLRSCLWYGQIQADMTVWLP